jgi:hypothetical protein
MLLRGSECWFFGQDGGSSCRPGGVLGGSVAGLLGIVWSGEKVFDANLANNFDAYSMRGWRSSVNKPIRLYKADKRRGGVVI